MKRLDFDKLPPLPIETTMLEDFLKDVERVEINPITTYISGGEAYVDVTDYDEAECFGVYVRKKDGLATWVGDVALDEAAVGLAMYLAQQAATIQGRNVKEFGVGGYELID